MAEKIINGFSVVAYATQPEGRIPARAFLETRRLPVKADAAAKAPCAPDAQSPCETPDVEEEAESLAFEIFVSVVQAYIFTLLSAVYIADSVEFGH